MMTEVGEPGICILPDCSEPRARNVKNTGYIRQCSKHAEEHRERCRQSYKRRVARNEQLGKHNNTVGELQSQLTEERITNRKLRARLESIQKEHDTFVAAITAAASPGTPKGDATVLSVLQLLHGSISELIVKTENEDSYKQRYQNLENKFDVLLEEKKQACEKIAYLKGQMLSHKQILDMIKAV